MNQQTRGERNNNPGNIDRNPNVHWQGQASDQSTDPRFIVFDSPEMGIRALAKIILTYYRAHQLNTVTKIIDRWAPPTENDTSAYVSHVASCLGVEPNDVINVENLTVLDVLVRAIITHENGRCTYTDEVIDSGVDKALA